MPLVYACIAPHGSEVIPALAGGKAKDFAQTRDAMKVLSRKMRDADPETIVVASPHNLRLLKHIGVVISENSSGKVVDGKREVKLRAKCDVKLAREILSRGEKNRLPVVGANYGALEGPLSDLAMDWGTLIPLWFLLRRAGLKSKVVIVTPSRGIPLIQNFEAGKVIAGVAEDSGRRVAFVASADQAHAHKKDGPYGYDSRAKEYDMKVVDAVKMDRLDSIMDMDQAFVEGAKPDSLWQMTMLAGALSEVPMKGELLSYQVPTYFGMLCASYTRRNQRRKS